MSTSKWKLGSWKRSSAGSRKSDTTPTSSSPTTTRTSALAVKPSSSSSSASGSGSGSSGSSNKSGKTSSSRSSTSSSSPFSWFRSSPRAKGRRSIISRDDPAFARLHKPFTPQNLEHQKLLSTFEWTFDDDDNDDNDNDERRRRRRRHRRVSLSLSPCASRDATVDDYAIGYGYGYGPETCHGDYNTTGMLPPNGRRDTLSDSLAHLSMRRAAGGGFDPVPVV